MKFNNFFIAVSIISITIGSNFYAMNNAASSCNAEIRSTKKIIISDKIKKEMIADGISEEMIHTALKQGKHTTSDGVDHYLYTIDGDHQIKFMVNKKSKLSSIKLLDPRIDNFFKNAKYLKGYEVTPHFKQRMFERAITKKDVEDTLKKGTIVPSDRTDGRVTYTYTNDQNEIIRVVVDPIHRQLITTISQRRGQSSKSVSPVSPITPTTTEKQTEVVEQPKTIIKPIPQYSKAYLARKRQQEKEAWQRQVLEEANSINEEDTSSLKKDIAKLGRSHASAQYERYLDEI